MRRAGVRAVCGDSVRAVHDRRRHLRARPCAGTPRAQHRSARAGRRACERDGTTGASMLLIRPLLAGNEGRQHASHAVVFFILLVGNVGGALSPLGDPPLFIGYLKGVDFFWTTRALALPTIAVRRAARCVLCAGLYSIGTDGSRRRAAGSHARPIRVEGARNLLLLAGVVGAVLLSGAWKPGIAFNVLGTPVELRTRCATFCSSGSPSFRSRSRRRRPRAQRFPLGSDRRDRQDLRRIFITIIPVIAAMQAGNDGAWASIAAGRRRDGAPRDHRCILGHRRVVRISRQRTDVPRVLQSRGRRCAGAGRRRRQRSRRFRWRRYISAR